MTSANPAIGSSRQVAVRFTLLCALLLLAAVCLEPLMGPLNRATAVLSGNTLVLFGFSPMIRGDLITLAGFTVRIVSECTSLYATLLLAAYILARPATWRERLAGVAAGSIVIWVVNLLRIAGVTVIGVRDPVRFEIIHVYLGQVVMLVLVLYCCLTWTRWNSGKKGNNSFLLLAVCWSTILFLPWLYIHKVYLGILDLFVLHIFSLMDSRHTVALTLETGIYNHPFSVPVFLALLLASTGIGNRRRIAGAIIGVLIISIGHMLFRITHIIWNMYDLKWIANLHMMVYLFGQFLLPVLIWLLVADFTPVPAAAQRDRAS